MRDPVLPLGRIARDAAHEDKAEEPYDKLKRNNTDP